MDAAFVNYIALSKILREDVNALLNQENNTQHWRRNFIRASVSLIEGYVHCVNDLCAVISDCNKPEINKKEAGVLQSEKNHEAYIRFKLTLRAAYRIFQLEPAPNFGASEWEKAQQVLKRRNLIMHPKTPADLEIPDELWDEIRDAIAWLMKQLFDFFSLLVLKYEG